jgi:DNA-directed RNA polymerase subunit H (RpoH/RPB5)
MTYKRDIIVCFKNRPIKEEQQKKFFEKLLADKAGTRKLIIVFYTQDPKIKALPRLKTRHLFSKKMLTYLTDLCTLRSHVIPIEILLSIEIAPMYVAIKNSRFRNIYIMSECHSDSEEEEEEEESEDGDGVNYKEQRSGNDEEVEFEQTHANNRKRKVIIKRTPKKKRLVKVPGGTETKMKTFIKILQGEEKKEIIEKFTFKDTGKITLPKIRYVDAITKALDADKGDVIKFMRPTETSGRISHYKIVI